VTRPKIRKYSAQTDRQPITDSCRQFRLVILAAKEATGRASDSADEPAFAVALLSTVESPKHLDLPKRQGWATQRIAISLGWEGRQWVQDMPKILSVELDPACIVEAPEQFCAWQSHVEADADIGHAAASQFVEEWQGLREMLWFVVGKPDHEKRA